MVSSLLNLYYIYFEIKIRVYVNLHPMLNNQKIFSSLLHYLPVQNTMVLMSCNTLLKVSWIRSVSFFGWNLALIFQLPVWLCLDSWNSYGKVLFHLCSCVLVQGDLRQGRATHTFYGKVALVLAQTWTHMLTFWKEMKNIFLF